MVSNQRSDMVESAGNLTTRHGKPAFETSSTSTEQSTIDRAGSSPRLRTWMFVYTAVEVVLLLAVGATYVIRTDLVSTYLPRDWERAALQALWFGMLGGAAISLKGIYEHRTQREWEGGWALWYMGRPVSSALTGVMTYILLQVANPNSPPATAVLAVAAFTLGTQERRFFDFLYEVAKLVLAVPQDRAQVRAPAPTPPPEPSMAASPRRLSTLTALPTSSGLLLGSDGGSVIPEHVGPGEASGSAKGFSIADHGGKVLLRVQVQLLFWGTAWTTQPAPPVSDITDAVASILSGPYMSGLSQYRGVGVGRLGGAVVVDSSDPPNPFTDRDIAHLVRSQIRASKVPEPESDPGLMYCVMLPPGVRAADSRIIGEHSYFFFWDLSPPLDVDASLAHYAWITNDGSLDYVTSVFSHELVESCTDPEGTAFTSASGCPGTGWCEIGDVCFTSRSLEGVNVQSYWSEKDHVCVIPGVPAPTAQ